MTPIPLKKKYYKPRNPVPGPCPYCKTWMSLVRDLHYLETPHNRLYTCLYCHREVDYNSYDDCEEI